MAGTPHGRHSIIVNTGLRATNSQVLFTSLFKALEALDTLGVVNRIALYFGDAGAGTNYYDEASPFTTNAFAVYEMPPAGSRTWSWYFLIQWGDSNPYGGSGNGSPAKIRGSAANYYYFLTGYSVAAATTSGGASANPWTEAGGTTNNDGTDAKADPVWAAPAGGNLYVLPQSNATGGASAASRDDQLPVVLLNASDATRVHFLVDDDNLFWAVDTADDGSYWMSGVGAYVPLTGMSVEAPLWSMFSSAASGWEWDQEYNDSDGGVISPLDGSTKAVRWDVRPECRNVIYQPNNQFSPPEYMESPLALYADETEANPGMVGFIDSDFVRHTYNIPTNSTVDSQDRVVIGGAVQAVDHFTVVWDSTTTDPTAASDRDGTDF